MFNNYSIDKIKEHLNIKSQKGDELVCLCPFHTETEPSFYFNTVKNTYYCFGCGEKGNIKTLYEHFNIETPKKEFKQIKPKNIQEFLKYKLSATSVAYWNKRGISEDDLKKISSVGWDAETNQPVFLFNYQDKLVWHSQTQWEKGLEKPATTLFYKSGLDYENISTTNKVFITEGEKDTIILSLNGLLSFGVIGANNFTEKHLEILKNVPYNAGIYLCFDNDSAGRKATEHTYEIINKHLHIPPQVLNWKKVKEVFKVKLHKGFDINDLWILYLSEQNHEQGVATPCSFAVQFLKCFTPIEDLYKINVFGNIYKDLIKCIYYYQSSTEKDGETITNITPITDFIMDVVYQIRDRENNTSYYLRLAKNGFMNGKQSKVTGYTTITSEQMSDVFFSAKHIAKVGNYNILHNRNRNPYFQTIKNYECEHPENNCVVQVTPLIGNIDGTDWLFGDKAFIDGKFIERDKNDDRLYLTNNKGYYLEGNLPNIEVGINAKQHLLDLYESFANVFGYQGVIAYGFAIATAMINRIMERTKEQNFPILLFEGESQSGKTSLAENIMNLFGLMKFGNPSPVALTRTLQRYSCIPINTDNIEAKRKMQNIVDNIRNWYDRNGLIYAKYSSDLSLTEFEIRASLIICSKQKLYNANQDVQIDDIINRVLYVPFEKEKIRDENAFYNLNDDERKKNFLPSIIPIIDDIINLFDDSYILTKDNIESYCNNDRVKKNWSKVIGILRAFLYYFTRIDLITDKKFNEWIKQSILQQINYIEQEEMLVIDDFFRFISRCFYKDNEYVGEDYYYIDDNKSRFVWFQFDYIFYEYQLSCKNRGINCPQPLQLRQEIRKHPFLIKHKREKDSVKLINGKTHRVYSFNINIIGYNEELEKLIPQEER